MQGNSKGLSCKSKNYLLNGNDNRGLKDSFFRGWNNWTNQLRFIVIRISGSQARLMQNSENKYILLNKRASKAAEKVVLSGVQTLAA